MQVLLVSEDEGYADDLAAAADAAGVEVTVLDGERRVSAAARRIGADAVVFDAEDAFPVVAGEARAFAVLHPDLVVGVVATGVEDGDGGGLVVRHRWRAPERLLDALASARGELGRREGAFIT